MEIPKSYDPGKVEPKWQKHWSRLGLYSFRRNDYDAPTYVIDTPPPYPSGEFHIGNALNWIYFDVVARYKRMQGYNVLFPQGWDCHGLPTEVQVEKQHDIRKGDVPTDKFRKLCVELTEKNIAKMKDEMNSLGLSIDWSTEYRTMDPEYFGKTQLSFLKLFEKDLIYRGKHPVNWCPRCETAIADAEVEYEDREGTLNYINFKVKGEDDELTIATTRPELLPACVLAAVHPTDDRYSRYVGKELEVPLFGQTVKVVEDSEVDPDFGTGAVMICTYGDKADVEWAERYDLPVLKCIDEKGNLTEVAGDYAGLSIDEGMQRMLDDLDEVGQLLKQEDLKQSVGVCWRCKTPIEILTKDQWFMAVMDLNDKVIEEAKRLKWIPNHMRLRLIDWASSMDWDWVISRQRIFATPIPIWYCSDCGEPIIADEKQLPVTPIKDDPPIEECPECGCERFEPEEDVLDTWMDSSITIAVHAGWPEMDSRLFPADLQPNGTDIIRTWDYYLLVRHLAMFGEPPYKTLLINGMVFGEDGRKMSKSVGNYVETRKVLDRYGADALRQWAAIGASTGSDVPFSWKEVEFGHRFMRKLWNSARFAAPHIPDIDPEVDLAELDLRPSDEWILSRVNGLVGEVTRQLEEFQFNQALRKIRTFVWHEFCDMYIEEVKHRLYGDGSSAKSAKLVLHSVLWTVIRLLAPFVPHFCEEIYHSYFSQKHHEKSIHQFEWPGVKGSLISEEAEELGNILNSIVRTIRQFKSDRDMPLNTKISTVEIYAQDDNKAEKVEKVGLDIKGTARMDNLKVKVGKPEVEERFVSVEPKMSKLGPRLRNDSKAVAQALKDEDPGELAEQLAKGAATIRTGGKEYELSSDDVEISKEFLKGGRKVEFVDLPKFGLILVFQS